MAIALVNTGKAIIANRIKGLGAEPNYISWGTGAGTTDPTDTDLFDESTESRVSGTSSVTSDTTTDDTYEVVGTITAEAPRSITNAGLFNDPTTGSLFVKGDFLEINLDTNDAIQFTFKVTLS